MRLRGSFLLLASLAGCGRKAGPIEPPAASTSVASVAPSPQTPAVPSASVAASASAKPAVRETGPFEIGFQSGATKQRKVYFVAARRADKPQRLVAMLHGVCNPPAYACGLWADTAKELGFLVCPQGAGTCGPAMYDAPTWTGGTTDMDADIEASVAAVSALYPEQIDREGAVLVGFSRGGYAAISIAAAHPGRWPFLVINEANVSLSVPQLAAAKVRAVAFLAGEKGSQVQGERATAQALAKAGFPARLWVMPNAGHHYSDDIAALMKEAIDWAVAH